MDTFFTIVMLLFLLGACYWINSLQQRLQKANEELCYWHEGHNEARRWLAEFEDAADALDHVKAWSEGKPGEIVELRADMRARRQMRAYL